METVDVLWATALLILLSMVCASLAVLVVLVRTIAALYREHRSNRKAVPGKALQPQEFPEQTK